jgi:hypothetical protein
MPAPHELVAAPLKVYLAVVGTAFPEIDDAEADFDMAWGKLGTETDLNYDDSGVDVAHDETVNDFVPAGSTMPVKRFRTAESFLTKLNLVDVSPEQYAKVMNDATITTTPPSSGVAGKKAFSLFRGIVVNSFAVYMRGMSSVDNDLNMEVKFSKAFVSVNGSVVWKKGDPAMLPIEILAIRHSDSDLIEMGIETGAAS